jgi:hypothetical protein
MLHQSTTMRNQCSIDTHPDVAMWGHHRFKHSHIVPFFELFSLLLFVVLDLPVFVIFDLVLYLYCALSKLLAPLHSSQARKGVATKQSVSRIFWKRWYNDSAIIICHRIHLI